MNLPGTSAVAPSAYSSPAPLPTPRWAEERRATTPARDQLVGTAEVERLLVTTQKRRSPGLRVGTASCPDQVRLADGTRVVALIRGRLQPTARGADVRCGTAKVRVVGVGSTIAG